MPRMQITLIAWPVGIVRNRPWVGLDAPPGIAHEAIQVIHRFNPWRMGAIEEG